ncbi:hypothetical protein ACXWR7_11520, partial [Streptococcus pyogenes]
MPIPFDCINCSLFLPPLFFSPPPFSLSLLFLPLLSPPPLLPLFFSFFLFPSPLPFPLPPLFFPLPLLSPFLSPSSS